MLLSWAQRADPPAPSLVITRNGNQAVTSVIVQPVSGATITARVAATAVSGSMQSATTLTFPGLPPVVITATAATGTTLTSLSCDISCGAGCTAPALPASGQTADVTFSAGTTYALACSAATASDTTTASLTLEVLGECLGLR